MALVRSGHVADLELGDPCAPAPGLIVCIGLGWLGSKPAEGGYVVTCPALPGLVTEGDTLAEARKMARDAIRANLESLRKDGEAIPSDPNI